MKYVYYLKFAKNQLCSLICVGLLCMTPVLSSAQEQEESIASEMSNSSCSPGGEIWVCGPSEIARAHSHFNSNCSEWEYRCGQTLKTIKDVCSPEIVVSTISSKAC